MRPLSRDQQLAISLSTPVRKIFWALRYYDRLPIRQALNEAILRDADNRSPLEQWR